MQLRAAPARAFRQRVYRVGGAAVEVDQVGQTATAPQSSPGIPPGALPGGIPRGDAPSCGAHPGEKGPTHNGGLRQDGFGGAGFRIPPHPAALMELDAMRQGDREGIRIAQNEARSVAHDLLVIGQAIASAS